MSRVILISCVSKKLNRPARARELYTSALFQRALRYAEGQNPDAIYILSAKYGLVGLDDELEPYEETLNKKPEKDIRAWAEKVFASLGSKHDVYRDTFVFLAGERYRKCLVPHLRYVEVPMRGLGIGRQLQFLNRAK